MHLGPEQGTGTGIHPRPDQSSPHNECPATGAWRRGGEVWGEWESPPPLEMAFSKNTDDSSADVFCWVWPLSTLESSALGFGIFCHQRMPVVVIAQLFYY